MLLMLVSTSATTFGQAGPVVTPNTVSMNQVQGSLLRLDYAHQANKRQQAISGQGRRDVRVR